MKTSLEVVYNLCKDRLDSFKLQQLEDYIDAELFKERPVNNHSYYEWQIPIKFSDFGFNNEDGFGNDSGMFHLRYLAHKYRSEGKFKKASTWYTFDNNAEICLEA